MWGVIIFIAGLCIAIAVGLFIGAVALLNSLGQ